MTAQSVTIVGARLSDDDVVLVVDGTVWAGWSSVHITRGIERMPGSFQITLTELYPDEADAIDIRPGQSCELWVGTRTKPANKVITGYIDRYVPMISPGAHTVTIVGRGKCQDLIDCSAEWPGQQIIASSVREVATKLAAPFGIAVSGEPGDPVGSGPLIPSLNLMLGETPWEVIDRLCRISGLLAYELPDGGLRISSGPYELIQRVVGRPQSGDPLPVCSGFAERVNVQRAQVTYSMDQRNSRYRTYVFSFDPVRDLRADQTPIAETLDQGVPRYRPRDIVMEQGHALAYEIATRRNAWEANRRWGQSRVLTLTTDAWRDATGMLYAPMMLAGIDIPSLKVSGQLWVISEVTYRKDDQGTECDLTLMPPQAFSVRPTLPPASMPWELATTSRGAGQP